MCCTHTSPSRTSPSHTSRRGLSRTDFVIVLCVTGVVISLVIVILGRQRREHMRWVDRRNFKFVALAIHSFAGSYKRLPPAFDRVPTLKMDGAVGDAWGLSFAASMHVHLLPYVEQDELYKSCVKQGEVVADAVVSQFLGRREEDEAGVQHFTANLRVFSDRGVSTSFDRPMPRLAEIEPGTARFQTTFTDGTSNTIAFSTKFAKCGDGGSRYAAAPNTPFAAFFGEVPAISTANSFGTNVTFQLAPADHECLSSPLLAQSFSEFAITVALADGSVRQVAATISPGTWNAAMQPNDGNQLGEDW
ncbi:MAG: DUF1559 domain-containing protein [Planctomycetes bacterium]|nr:DUF1559 domain-containing protein [Planctomycetota bacterium]